MKLFKRLKIREWICKIFGHKISQTQLLVFQIKNNPVNVQRHGYSTITCPRCKALFNPEPKPDIKTQDETLHGTI